MEDRQSLSHTRWQCKYHVIFIPKYRRRVLFGRIRKELGPVFHRLARQKECWIEEGHIMPDHVHMLLNVPPKLAVSSVVGFIKGKSAIHVARHVLKRERNYAGQVLWARGFFVDTVGADTEKIRKYIREQEAEDRRLDQLELPHVTDPKPNEAEQP
jgi:putative transposase